MLKKGLFRLPILTLFMLFTFSSVTMAVQETGTSQPTKQSTQATKTTPTKVETPAAKKIDINKADAAGFQELKGVGPKLAQDIVKYREENGPFKSVEDIQKVKGIGAKKFESLKDQITVE